MFPKAPALFNAGFANAISCDSLLLLPLLSELVLIISSSRWSSLVVQWLEICLAM